MGEERERALVSGHLDGDEDPFTVLVKRCSGPVFAICLGILGNVPDAEDAAQETFLKAHDRLGQLRDGARFQAWVCQIARHLCTDLVRRRGHREKVLMTLGEGRLASASEHHELHDAINRLPENLRLPLLLYYFEGRSSEGVGKALHISTAAALTRLSRARRELRRLLELGKPGR